MNALPRHDAEAGGPVSTDMAAEGAPPPGKGAATTPATPAPPPPGKPRKVESPFTGPLGHKRPPWGKKR